MPFETKSLGEIHCPRCNGMAQLRIDHRQPIRNFVFVYIVCPICKLNKYNHTTTRKSVILQSRINRLKKKDVNNLSKRRKINAKIKKLENLSGG